MPFGNIQHNDLTPSDLRGVLTEVGARAMNVGNKKADALAKRVLLQIGKLDEMMRVHGSMQAEFKFMCEVAGDLVVKLKKEESNE